MKLLSNITKGQKGSSAIFAISLAAVCIFLLLGLFDICSIYILREQTKDVSEAIALALAQELLFFDQDELNLAAGEMAGGKGCSLAACNIGYDGIEISVERKVELAILDRIGLSRFKTVRSSSSVKIIYPWDRSLGSCHYYKFGYRTPAKY
ncbi:MAG: hypothetical protein K8S14_10950 [Actinomycetia bacterium]|nr:hypothetical protein [Actinomycetes bacterium]